MPTPAIAKAAEEIALRFCGDSTASGSDFIEPVKEILTRHFATAPAPDDGPITEEVLSSLGGEPLDCGMYRFKNRDGIEVFGWNDGTVNFGDTDHRTTMTRSSLLQLLSVLNIPVVEKQS